MLMDGMHQYQIASAYETSNEYSVTRKRLHDGSSSSIDETPPLVQVPRQPDDKARASENTQSGLGIGIAFEPSLEIGL